MPLGAVLGGGGAFCVGVSCLGRGLFVGCPYVSGGGALLWVAPCLWWGACRLGPRSHL